jgi:uncharacterized protein (DUF427 family)
MRAMSEACTDMTTTKLLPETAEILAARAKWQFRGRERPEFAESPRDGQTSVWDFPRPPIIQACPERLRVLIRGQEVAATNRGVHVIETAGAPTYYFPPLDVDTDRLEFVDYLSLCEWKGLAEQINVDGIANAGWRYVQVFEEFYELANWMSFYPAKVECFVGDERATAQPGGYYGGWVTKDLAGPIKGLPGSQAW